MVGPGWPGQGGAQLERRKEHRGPEVLGRQTDHRRGHGKPEAGAQGSDMTCPWRRRNQGRSRRGFSRDREGCRAGSPVRVEVEGGVSPKDRIEKGNLQGNKVHRLAEIADVGLRCSGPPGRTGGVGMAFGDVAPRTPISRQRRSCGPHSSILPAPGPHLSSSRPHAPPPARWL